MPARHRFAPARPAVLLGLLVGLFFGPATPSLAPHARIAPLARTASAQTTPDLVVPLYGNALTFRTVPQTAVSAELASASGAKKDEGIGVAGADGVAGVQFFLGGATIQPLDRITLSRTGAKPLRVTVPTLGAAVDVAGDRILGRVPAGAIAELSITTGGATPSTIERSVTADASGMFALALAGEVDLAAGAVSGTLHYTNSDNQRFQVAFAALGADLTLGAFMLRGRANAGTNVTAEIRHAGGSPQAFGPVAASGDGTFVMPLFAPSGPGAGAQPQPLAAGDTVTVRTEGDPVADDALTATLAPLTVAINAASDRISGTAAPGVALRLTADDMDGQQAAFDTASDANGLFSVATVGQADLGAGWRVRASYEPVPGVRVIAVAVIRKVRVAVGFLAGQGRAEPGQAVTVTLRSSAGAVKMQQRAFVNDQGAYNLFGGGGFGPPGLAPAPGDAVEIAFVDGDPDVLRVPTLTARANVDADTVSGEAPAGATVRVRVETSAGAPSFTAVTNASGMYEVPTAPSVDLARPANGTVSVRPTEGAEFYTTWAAIQLTVNGGNTFQSNFVTGNGPLQRTITAELFTPDGKLVGRASGPVFGGNAFFVGPAGGTQPQFFLQLTDTTGTQVTMLPGDTLKVTAGDDAFELQIPPLDAVIFVQTDTVNGHTLPGNKVRMQIAGDPTGGISATADTTADAAGNFSHSFAGTWDVKYGDFVLLTTNVGGHLALNMTIAPGMLVDADQAQVLGSLAPNIAAVVTLRRGGQTIDAQSTSTDGSGALAVNLMQGGAPAILRTGDVISVTPADPNVAPLSLTLPELTVQAAVDTDVIEGRATAGGSMTMLAIDTYGRQGSLGLYQAWPSVEPGGTYAADFVPRVDVRPGTRVYALYRPAAGHYVVRSHTVPILNAEHTGPNACGFGEARGDVAVDLVDAAGRMLAGARTKARFDGFFSGILKDPAGAAVASAASLAEKAKLGATATADVALPTLDVQVNWQTRQVSGTGPASTTFFVQPAVPCDAQAPGGILNVNVQFANPQQTGPDGAIQSFVPGNAGAPGSGLEIALYAPSDHRVFRHIYRALAQVHIHTGRVAGRANPLDDVTIVVKAADGTERGRAAGKADETGRFDMRVQDAAGSAVTIHATDVVTLQTPAEAPVVPVEPLAFDWSPGAAEVVGSAPAGRTVQVVVRLNSGVVYTIPRTADPSGTVRFGAADVPPRGGWAMGDVKAVRLVLPTASGHQIIDQTADFEAPDGPGPGGSDGRTIYLPYGFSNRRAGAAHAAGSQAPRAESNVANAPSAAPHPIAAPRAALPAASSRVDPATARQAWQAMTSLLRAKPAASVWPTSPGVR